MPRSRSVAWEWAPPWLGTLVVAGAVALLAAHPVWLVPVAHGYQRLCARAPILATLGDHIPPISLALLLILALLVVLAGAISGTVGVARTIRFNRSLSRDACPMPPRLTVIAGRLGVESLLLCVDRPGCTAFCYGLLLPRIAVTADLVTFLDDEELLAVLAHERHHLHRRDPLRYLLIRSASASAFMLPVVAALRLRLETRFELAADRAALAAAPRHALASALLLSLRNGRAAGYGIAGLSATEARIAHLARQPIDGGVPIGVILASLGFVAVVLASTAQVASSTDLVETICTHCANLL